MVRDSDLTYGAQLKTSMSDAFPSTMQFMEPFRPSLESLLLKFLEQRAEQAISKREMARQLHLTTAEHRAQLRALLRRLENEGKLVRLHGNRWVLPDSRRRATGELRVHPHRFGFVTPDSGGDDIYIPEEGLYTALDGDRVLVEIQRGSKTSNGRPRKAAATLSQGRIVRIIQRRRTRLTGRLCKSSWYWYVIPDSPRVIHTVRIRAPSQNVDLVEGNKVWVQLDEWSNPGEPLTGVVIEDLGPCERAGVDILSIMRDYGIEADFPSEVAVEVRRLMEDHGKLDTTGREDLRDETVITIDPAEAKDFDDAVSVAVLADGGFKLGVHIADVAHFVRPGTALDREAFLRGNSVYLVDRAIPMLPPELSSHLCSLQPGEDRLTHTVEIIYDSRAVVRSARTFLSVIRSSAKLTYDQVQNLFDGRVETDIPPPIQETLFAMRKLASILRKNRMSSGSLDLWMPEIRCVLDEAGEPIALLRRGADEAYNLIEEFMLAANRVVAERIAAAEIPSLYRIHPPPEKRQWDWMQQELEALDISLKSRSRNALNDIARRFAKSASAHIVHLAILRNLKRASYSPTVGEHFGLAFSYYTHFTSPIRRYPDLVVHRTLRALEQRSPPPLTAEETARIAEHCSWTERNADEAEEESLDLKRMEYFARLLQRGEIGPYEGIVVNVTPRGPVVELTESLLRGLLPFRSLGRDYFLLNDARTEARTRHGKATWRIGQKVRVCITRVDRMRRQVDFAPAGESAHETTRSSPRARSRP